MITQLRAEVAGLRENVIELKRQLGQNSSNSSRPPSSDSPFVKLKEVLDKFATHDPDKL